MEKAGVKVLRDLTDKSVNFSTLATSNIKISLFFGEYDQQTKLVRLKCVQCKLDIAGNCIIIYASSSYHICEEKQVMQVSVSSITIPPPPPPVHPWRFALRRNRQKFEIFFCKVSSLFSQKIINIQLYISCKAFIRSIV